MASLLFEAHLALAFAASASKSPRALGLLSRSVPLSWLLGALLAVAILVTSQPVWQGDDYACHHLSRMWVKMVTTLAIFIVCLVCYVISSCYVLTSGEAVQRSISVRAQTYVVIAMVFMAPMIVYDASGDAIHEFWSNNDLTVYMICKTLYNLNGLLNFAMYTVHCRQARQLRFKRVGDLLHDTPSKLDTKEHVFSVGFREGDSFQEELESQSRENLESWPTKSALADEPSPFQREPPVKPNEHPQPSKKKGFENESFDDWFEWEHMYSASTESGSRATLGPSGSIESKDSLVD